MRIILVGGPYNGEVKDAPTIGDYSPIPTPYLDMFPPLEPETKFIGEAVDPKKTIQILRYELKEIWKDGRFHQYEYHYQGL